MLKNIQILSADKINQSKWDQCINNASNGLIYSRYDYLDIMCDNWHGLVINDYDAVMALPWRKKFGIRYLYQPAFIQQLGLIGEYENVVEEIIPLIHSFSKYGDILFNFANVDIISRLNVSQRVNLVIDLSKDYEAIYSDFRKDLINNLRKSEKERLHISTEENINLAINMYKHLYKQRMKNLTDDEYLRFERLCFLLQQKNMCFTRTVKDEAENTLAIGLFLKDEKRIYNLMNSTTDEGRTKEANHFLLAQVITEFSGSDMLFDFEGSDIPGVKSFYEKFGAVDQPYFYYHYNKLPKLLRLIKP